MDHLPLVITVSVAPPCSADAFVGRNPVIEVMEEWPLLHKHSEITFEVLVLVHDESVLAAMSGSQEYGQKDQELHCRNGTVELK